MLFLSSIKIDFLVNVRLQKYMYIISTPWNMLNHKIIFNYPF